MNSPSQKFDVVIIGGGLNGITAAAYLARRGNSVCVLEKSDRLGGMAQDWCPAPGILLPRMAHLLPGVHPKILRELRLGNQLQLRPLHTTLLALDGRHVQVSEAGVCFADGSPHDESAAFLALRRRIARFAGQLAPLALMPPPEFAGLADINEAGTLARLGVNIRMMGKKEVREFLRIILSNVYDLTLDELPDGLLAGCLAADAVLGAWAGPRSPGSVFSLMYRYGTGVSPMIPEGGISQFIRVFTDFASSHGAEFRTASEVTSVMVENDAVTGVVLDGGTQISARAVLSGLSPMATMKLAGVEHFDTEAVRRIRNVRSKGMTGKLNMVLTSVPKTEGLADEQFRGRTLLAPSVQYSETAFNSAKYGEIASDPVLEIMSPELTGSADGLSALSVTAHYVPHALKDGWSDESRDKLTETILTALEKYIPDIRSRILHTETLSPVDIEALTGAPGGHWHHCELSTDQLLNVRPVNGMSRYAFALKGFYLCGASAHPGGNLTCAPGRNAALQVIRDGILR